MTTGRHETALRLALAMERPMTSLIERAMLPDTAELVTMRHARKRLVLDYGHKVTGDDGRSTAIRGIDWKGRLLWHVAPAEGESRLSYATCPFEAMAAAPQAPDQPEPAAADPALRPAGGPATA